MDLQNIFGIPSVDSLIATLAATATKLQDVAMKRQEEVVKLTDKVNHAINERDRADRIAQKILDLLK
jgi:hypothetical protein